jgi:transposase
MAKKLSLKQKEVRRLRAARLLDKGLTQAEVARRVGVHRQSVNRWAQQLEAKGPSGLKSPGRTGRKPRLAARDLEKLEEALKAGPEAYGYSTLLWTTERVALLIKDQCGVRYHPDHVGRLLGRLGWSCQRPIGRARERDEKAIERWKKRRWPEIKKKPARKAAPWSSSMKAA